MTRIPSPRIGFLAAVIVSSSQCYSESRFENVSRSEIEISRGLSKQSLIVYGRPQNNGGSNADDSGTVNKGAEEDVEDTFELGNQETFTFERPSNSGDFDLLPEEAPEREGGEADRIQILGPECKIGVNIGCIGSNNIQCDQLEVPSTQCSVGKELMNLGIKVISSDCHESRMTQDDHFYCESKENPIPDDGAVVEIFCFEGSGNWEQLVHTFAFVGETEINFQNADGKLPKSIMCNIRDSDGNDVQWVTFDTSGTVDLFLKNAFGMIQVESCTVRDRATQSCRMPVQYNYTVSNIGPAPLNLMKVERRRNSDIMDLTPQTPVIELRAGDGTPGDATSVVEDDLLDLCIPEHYETTVTASSDSLRQGTPCFEQSAYTFQFPGIGHMDVEIDCISIDGVNCTELGQKAESCWTPITYTFDVKNVGTTDLTITYVEVLQKGNELDMASFFLDNKILPSEKTSVNYVDHINLCVDGEYETTVSVKAESTINDNKEDWENYESYQFEVKVTPFPTTTPTSEKPSKLPSSNPTSPSPSLYPTTMVPSQDPTPRSSATPSAARSQNPTLVSSNGPTNIPTSVPSPIPTLMKSGVPSVEVSQVPSIEVSTSPSLSHSNMPTPVSSAHPTAVVSMSPSTDPTSGPTSNPTPTKNNSPPLIPNEDTTSPPTIHPSKQPTPSPITTASPSSIPSISPTQNPTDQCSLEFYLSCVAPIDLSSNGSCSFNYKQPTVCQEQPSRLKLRYTGGDCTLSSNLQGNTFFICEDYGINNFGPSNLDGSIAFIRIVDYADNNAIRFDGFVRVGEDIDINGMGPNLNVTIYDPKSLSTSAEIMKPENILQTLVFHTTCPAPTSNLYLKDRFGSVQIVEFENTIQGIVSSFQQLTLNVEIRSDFEVDLLSTNIVTNIDNGFFGIYNLTNEASGKRISKSQPFRTTQKVTIDLARRKTYTAQGVVVGKRTLGNECYGSGENSFVAGAPLPPSIPTVPPTVAPSASGAPSTDPLFTRCDLDASISCKTSDGRSCSDLKAPLGSTCVGKSAEQLSFTYIPSSNCNATNSQDRFICNDFNLDLKRPFTSFIRVFRGTDVFFEGVVSAGELFRVQLPSNTKEIETSVFTVSSSESAGILLEQMQLSVACREKDELTLLQKYGHLQLNGFVNEDMGSKQIFANLDLTYRVQNIGIFDALVTTATTDSPFTGIGDEVLPTNAPRQNIAPGEELTFTESATLNLIAAVGQDFDFFFEASGVSAFNNFVCSDIGELSLQIR